MNMIYKIEAIALEVLFIVIMSSLWCMNEMNSGKLFSHFVNAFCRHVAEFDVATNCVPLKAEFFYNC